jgi:hypothetical protein
MAAGRNSDGIKQMILELVQGGQGLDQIRQRLNVLGEETAEANLGYAGSLVKVRDDLRAPRLGSRAPATS